jgi:histidinol-phosphate/aromatic aminotransferase/cobyric acid decarboxylase-like protein
MRTEKNRLVERLKGRSFVNELFAGQANFVLFSTPDANALLDFCAARHIILRGFPADPELRDCVRISIGTAEEMDALYRVFEEWERSS